MAARRQEEVFDVIVVGGGGSGLAAAIEARVAGARVVLLEKNAVLGGSTAWSIGSITTTGTPHQRRRRIVDTPEDHFIDMPLFADDQANRNNPRESCYTGKSANSCITMSFKCAGRFKRAGFCRTGLDITSEW